jgi:hypothetical protein
MTYTPRIALRRIAVPAIALLLAVGAAACDRTSMGAAHGRAYREAFARQALDPLAGEKPRSARAFQGLDSQEASIVARTYRRGLAPKETSDGQMQPMLLMSPGAGARDTGNVPPASVPDR